MNKSVEYLRRSSIFFGKFPFDSLVSIAFQPAKPKTSEGHLFVPGNVRLIHLFPSHFIRLNRKL